MIETINTDNQSYGRNIHPLLYAGLNTVIHSDWREAIKQVPDKSVDLLVTDPPYGMQFQSNRREVRHKSIQGDDSLEWLGGWAKEIHRVMKQEAHLYIFCSWHNVDSFKREIGAFFNIKNILIWEKNNHGSGDLIGDYAPKYEMILFCSDGSKKLNGGRDSNVLKTAKTGNENHPTEKPTNLLAYLIEKSSNVNDIVLDTFAGSFSTAQACIETGRNYLCFEIEEEYCRIARNLLAGKQRRMFI